ncbi:soil-associated protein, TIGR03435 family [Terriglobus roseus]|uniref:Soil-associated protein, TIGR03435 family n=2 Tax=Terriglobus roseus TaxID=392734 RepID=A0A1G7HY30_9BACT|nr:soil-associated protein, TIGR03435 family [Terriglobus roseus]
MTGKGTAATLLLVACAICSLHGQVPQPAQPQQETTTPTAAPLAFETVSIKPAPPGSIPFIPAFIRDKTAPVYGLQTMAGAVWLTISWAYRLQISEAKAAFEKQPGWVKKQIYRVTFRVEGQPTNEQLREMFRTMLADRFALEIHEFTKEGAVNKVVLSKPGLLGPKIHPHTEGTNCSTQGDASVGKAPDPSTPSVTNCGFSWYYTSGGLLHVGITNTTVVDGVRALAGIGVPGLDTKPIVDGTGLTGKYDLTLEFRPDSGSPRVDPGADDGAPTLIQAVAQQLGVRLESGTGPVRIVLIDHISEPTPD